MKIVKLLGNGRNQTARLSKERQSEGGDGLTAASTIKALGEGDGQAVGRRHNEFLYALKPARQSG